MANTTTNIVEIEVDSERNRALQFFPIERRIRGRLDLNRVAEPLAKMKTNEFPQPIPGQRLRFDFDSQTGYLVEPLRDEENQVLREKIERKGFRIAPEAEAFANADAATWLYWMQRAVKSGMARVTAGNFPTKLPGEPKKDFFFKRPEHPNKGLAAAIGELATATKEQTKLLAELVKSLKKD